MMNIVFSDFLKLQMNEKKTQKYESSSISLLTRHFHVCLDLKEAAE